jgi:uncharacterized 2Fe-2S/4Fe-4S cluster protein (DUF4445 family)
LNEEALKINHDSKPYYTINISNRGIFLQARKGDNLYSLMCRNGIHSQSFCGGRGTCGKCRVKVNNKTSLACQTLINEDMTVEIVAPRERLHSMAGFLSRKKIRIDSGVLKRYLLFNSRNRLVSDTELILRNTHNKTGFTLTALRKLPQVLRKSGYQVTAVACGTKIIDIEAGNTTSRMYGLSIDIGTTSIVVYLVCLVTGKVLGARYVRNPQASHGADVVSRIAYTMDHLEGLERLHREVVEAASRCLTSLCRDRDVDPGSIYRITFVGNTVMLQIFLGVDPAFIGHSPYLPALARHVTYPARQLGLPVNPEAECVFLPCVGAFIGADTVGLILAADLHRQKGCRLAIDIGTNGEIVLSAGGELFTCSTAAGPAFEGGQIEWGMCAEPGAISEIRLNSGIHIKTIDNTPPKGICGSGLIDILSGLLREHLVDSRGTLREDAPSPQWLKERICRNGKGREFIIAPIDDKKNIVLTQRDVRQLQLAKAATRAGIEILLKQAGVEQEDLDEIILSGAFGSSLNKENIRRIGLIPSIPLNKIVAAGNAAGAGGLMMLLNHRLIDEVEKICSKVKYLELSRSTDFSAAFLNHMNF